MQCNRSTYTIHVTTSNRFMLYELVTYYMLKTMLHTHECIAKTITYNIEHKTLLYNIMNKFPPRVHLN